MGFRFRKSFKIAPGVKVNFNKKSTGITFGGKGFHYTINSKGKKTTSVGIPGTGLSYSTSSGGKSKKQTKTSQGCENVMNTTNTQKWYQKTGYIILLLVLFFPVGIFLMWKYTNWNKKVKIAISVILALFFVISLFSSPNSDEPVNTVVPGTIIESTDTQSSDGIIKDDTVHATTGSEVTSKAPETTTKNETTTQVTTTNAPETTTAEKTPVAENTTEKQTTTERETTTEKPAGRTVYITPSGKRYHYDPDCGGKNSYSVSIDNVGGRTPCQKCAW
ncbi:MAG: DUF4236 domain-containing protein [Ruminococcus bromii]|nr:DUF4236 domain-containing protein [Ruminococcus bromii]